MNNPQYRTERNIMKIEKAYKKIKEIDKKYHNIGNIKQFSIDMIEYFGQELYDLLLGESDFSEEVIIGHLSYKISTALEICDDDLTDFYVLQELYDAIND